MRLVHAISSGAVSLANVQWLVLDEADRMFENGFEHQVKPGGVRNRDGFEGLI